MTLAVTESKTPVSYTHLDVYKRQVLTFTGITVAFCLLAFVGVMYRYSI